MSNKGTPFISFLAGALFGAVLALLYAPSSGEELRTQIRQEADTRLHKLSEEWDRTMQEVQSTLDKTRADISSYVEQLQAAQEKKVAEE